MEAYKPSKAVIKEQGGGGGLNIGGRGWKLGGDRMERTSPRRRRGQNSFPIIRTSNDNKQAFKKVGKKHLKR